MASGYIRGYSASASGTRDVNVRKEGGTGGRKVRHDTDRTPQSHYNGAQIQNVKAARVYVFGDDSVVEDDENIEFEMPEMRSRLKGPSHFSKPLEQPPDYFEKEIDEGETLQAIALKYACTVSDLKRLNNLIQDQEFFALKVLKVPMTRYGVLSEQFANRSKDHKNPQHSRHSNGAAAAASYDSDQEFYSNNYEESDSQHDFSDPETQMKVLRTLSIRDNISTQGVEAEKFLKKMDADLSKFKQSSQSSRSERESLSEVISVLTNKSIQPLETNRPVPKQNGATCGISWRSIICISLTIAIIVPVVFYVYFEFVVKNETHPTKNP